MNKSFKRKLKRNSSALRKNQLQKDEKVKARSEINPKEFGYIENEMIKLKEKEVLQTIEYESEVEVYNETTKKGEKALKQIVAGLQKLVDKEKNFLNLITKMNLEQNQVVIDSEKQIVALHEEISELFRTNAVLERKCTSHNYSSNSFTRQSNERRHQPKKSSIRSSPGISNKRPRTSKNQKVTTKNPQKNSHSQTHRRIHTKRLQARNKANAKRTRTRPRRRPISATEKTRTKRTTRKKHKIKKQKGFTGIQKSRTNREYYNTENRYA